MSEDQIWQALRNVIDPEIGIDVVELGLVYRVEVSGDQVHVVMTMTTQACPLHAYLSDAAEAAIREAAPEVQTVRVDMVFEPPWSPDRMSDAARRRLGWPTSS